MERRIRGRYRGAAVLAAVLLLAACHRGELPKPYVAPELPDDICGSKPLRQFVGQPASVLDNLYIPDPKRFVHAGDAVTQDYVPERLNIMLDAGGRISGLRCG